MKQAREALVKDVAIRVLRVLGYLAIVAFPLFLGWGLDDLRGFFSDPARTGYVGLCVVGVAALLIPRLNVQPLKKGKRVVGEGMLRVIYASMFFLALFLPFADRRSLATFAGREA